MVRDTSGPRSFGNASASATRQEEEPRSGKNVVPAACSGQTRFALDHRGHLDVLKCISTEHRRKVLAQCVQKPILKGRVIWRQGDGANCTAFVMSGKAMSTYHSPSGKTGVTGFWGAGDMLGCADLVTPCERQMTVRCLENAVIAMLPTAKFYDLTAKYQEFGNAVLRALSVRLRWVSHLALTLETANAFARLCSVLLALSERFSIEQEEGILIDLSLTNEDMAAIVGISRQFVNITLHDLQKQGVIALDQRKILITDTANLQRLAFNH